MTETSTVSDCSHTRSSVPCVWQRVWLRHRLQRACDTEQRLVGKRTGLETATFCSLKSCSNCAAASVQTMLLAAGCRGWSSVRALCDINTDCLVSTLNLYTYTTIGSRCFTASCKVRYLPTAFLPVGPSICQSHLWLCLLSKSEHHPTVFHCSV